MHASGNSTKKNRGRRWVWWLGVLVVATLALGAAALWSEMPRLVTWMALRDAEEHAAELRALAAESDSDVLEIRLFASPKPFEEALQKSQEALSERYGELFRDGYFDPSYFVKQVPPEGFTPEAMGPWLLLLVYGEELPERFGDDALTEPPRDTEAIEEILSWVRPVCRSRRAKECLVNLLIADYQFAAGSRESGSLFKLGLVSMLMGRAHDIYGWGQDSRPEMERILEFVGSRVGTSDWSTVLDHSRHGSAKVRSGSLLLLCHHPDRSVFLERARDALEDPSPLVRLAAAGTLAYHRDPSGAERLREGLAHERWELRWWSAKSLAYLGGTENRDAISSRVPDESDVWVQRELKSALHAFDGAR